MNIEALSKTTNPASQGGSATQKAYVVLRRMIVTGELKPGEQLKIETLRTLLDTGASPIREALSLLTSDQLVEKFDKRGFRTAAANQQNFEEILGLRCSLEDMALRQSVAASGKDWEEALVLSHHRMTRESRENVDAFEDLHKTFHMTLLSNCGSPILLRFCSQLYDLNVRYRYLAGSALDYKKRNVVDEHEQIMEAAINGDADLASERLLNHYRQTGAFLVGLFAGTPS